MLLKYDQISTIFSIISLSPAYSRLQCSSEIVASEDEIVNYVCTVVGKLVMCG